MARECAREYLHYSLIYADSARCRSRDVFQRAYELRRFFLWHTSEPSRDGNWYIKDQQCRCSDAMQCHASEIDSFSFISLAFDLSASRDILRGDSDRDYQPFSPYSSLLVSARIICEFAYVRPIATIDILGFAFDRRRRRRLSTRWRVSNESFSNRVKKKYAEKMWRLQSRADWSRQLGQELKKKKKNTIPCGLF